LIILETPFVEIVIFQPRVGRNTLQSNGLSQAYEFYTGLKDVGVETEMVVYPREGHSLQEYAHQLDVQKRVVAWFDKHLKP
jgi:hypothetical protein